MRQHVDDPGQPAAAVAFGRYLHRGAVLLDPFADDGIDQPPPRVVAIDQQFARHRAVGKRHDPRIAVEARIEHEARHQPRMQRAEIAHRVPDVGGRASMMMSLWMEAMV